VGDAATALESAVSERLANTDARSARLRLALEAAEMLAGAGVDAVRYAPRRERRHLRRVFREALSVSPKAYARLARFQRALHVVREDGHAGWASVAAAAGYCDQAHLIAEFHAIADVTPRALVNDVCTGPRVG
jgi:transcriptional regulator GlxA family with amidase domain